MIDKEHLRLWWNTFVGDGNFTEVRILGRFQYSGYFKSFDNLCTQLEPFTNMDDEQIYFVLNQIDSSCYARPQCEKFLKSVKVSTNDNDIVRRKFLMIDCDAIRKSSTNSSDSEYNAALQKARAIFRFLREQGFDDPIVCTSGNGAHLQIPVDLPNDEETTEIVKRFYKFLGGKFTDNQVDIDQKVYNLARLCKTYSTTAKKGANLPERPWRKAEILYIPKELKPTPIEKIKELADLLPKEEPKQAPKRPNRQYNNASFDLRTWLSEHNIVYKEENQGNSTKFVLQHCPWEDSHSSKKEWESALFQNADGQITFACFHSHCSDKTWFDYRQIYEPDAYNKPAYQPQQVVYVQQSKPQKPKYEIKEEIPELGEKWMSLSSVAKVDLTKLEKVKTGYTELDKKIGGLYMSEVTILSGSNASGKSSWLNSVILNIVQQNYKVALWSGELRADVLKSWLQMVAAGKENLRPSKYEQGRYYVPDSIGNKIDAWLDGKFFLYNNEYGNVASQVLNDVKILTAAGVKVFVIDNMMSMNIDVFDGDKNDKQKQFILALKDFAMKEQVHVILVAHPRKSVAFLRKTDISGSGDIINAVDNCFIFHRVNEDFIHAITDFYDSTRASQLRQYGNVLTVEKNRLMGVVDLMVGLHYEIESRRFKNTQYETIHYGWEQEPKQQSLTFESQSYNDMPFDAPDGTEAPF
jgi:KaiC/GvpD/RAD55 family RecA-like ATPase